MIRPQKLTSVPFLIFFFWPIFSFADENLFWQKKLDVLVYQRISNQQFADGAMAVVSANFPGSVLYGTVKEDTIFEIGSVTKAFTGILFADQVLKKIVSAGDLVEKHIPELKGTFVGSMALQDLATHKSGLSRIPKDLPLNENPYRDYTE